MQSKRTYMTAVQIGLAGIGAAFGILAISLLKHFGYDHLGELIAGSLSGILAITIFIPQWMEKFRQWWRLEDADDRAAEIGKLYQQLELERAARQTAEQQAEALRQRQGSKALQDIRQLLTDDDHRSLLERAESAEQMVEVMDRQLREQAEKMANDQKLFERMAARANGSPESSPSECAGELIFPYATKHLEAMCEAAREFWLDHDRATPAPHGIQKRVQNFLSERTGENARKVAELAAAIKPDDLPK